MDKINFTTSMKPKIAFKGHSLVTNPNGKKEYQFYLPTTQDVKPEVVIFDKNGKKTDVSDKLTKHENATIPVWSLPVSETKGQTVGYVFNTPEGRKIYDNTRHTLDGQYNEAIKSTRATHEMGKQMYHLMPDSFAANKGEIIKDENGKEVERNHVNKFGGKIEDIEAKLPEIKELGAKKIISTPIYGNDTLSNHGYWTQNPYQITSTLGDINSFKKLQTSLFKNGLGFVADGAFANEGLNGIHMQDLIRWGEQSPYLDWFDTKDFDSYGFKFGVLPPVGSEAEKHYDFKLINSPVIYKFKEDGTPADNFGKKNPDYKPSEPTYVQLFDRRLMDKNYINTEEKATEYAKKQTNNTYDIKNYKDSVQLLAFQVSPDTAKSKVKELATHKVAQAPATRSPFRNALKEWDNFAFNTVDKDATIRNWTGKKDIVALNYRNQDVQNYIINTVRYWTNETDKILTTTIAKDITQTTNKEELIKEYAKRFNTNISDEEIANILSGKYEVSLVAAKDTIKDELKDFPLLAAELPVEIQSLISDKNVTEGKSFNKTYENIEKVVAEIFAAQHSNVIKDGKLTEEGSQLFRLTSSDVMRYVAAYALSNEKPSIEHDAESHTTFIKKSADFNEKVLNNINYESGSRAEVVAKLQYAFEEGVKKLANDKEAQEDLATIIKNSTENVNKKDIEIAKSIISKLELGLDHRVDALKDIRDLDLITQNKVNENDVWPTVENFFKDFTNTIRAINPKSYIIGEITCLNNYLCQDIPNDKRWPECVKKEHNTISETGVTTQTNYTYIFNILNQIVHGGPEAGEQYHQGIGGLNGKLNEFFESGFADNIRYSHEGFGNHDKPRALHGFAIDISNFFYPKDMNNHKNDIIQKEEFKIYAEMMRKYGTENQKPMTNAADEELVNCLNDDFLSGDNGKAIKYNLVHVEKNIKKYFAFSNAVNELCNAINSIEENNVVRNALNEAVESAAQKLQMPEENKNKIINALYAYSIGKVDGVNADKNVMMDHFKTRAYNQTIKEAVKYANLGLNEEETEKYIATIHNEMLQPALNKYRATMEIMMALPGNPTFYAGDEYGETGFETAGNNVYQHNREQLHRAWANDENRPAIKAFHEEFKKTFNIRNQECFKPFVDGETVVINANNNLGGVYRYNKDSDVIAIFNTNGFDNTRAANQVKEYDVNELAIDNANFNIDNAYGTNEFVHVDKAGNEIQDGYYRMEGNKLKKYTDANFQTPAIMAITTAATYFVRKAAKTVKAAI